MSQSFDTIVIGAGIGGLVCANYLAKNGLKVLIIEKNEQLGGYCRSFSRGGYTFNTCIRGLVGAREGGVFQKILLELGLEEQIRLLRPLVYDEIQFREKSVALHNDPKRTVEEI